MTELPTLRNDQQAWLVMSKTDYRRLGGGSKHDDDPTRHYGWDSTVPNFRQVKVGDVFALWNESGLMGVSVVDRIDQEDAIKRRGRCTNCGKTNYEPRPTMPPPLYHCYDCGEQFDDPQIEELKVKRFRSSHEQAWVALPGALSGKELRSLCVKPKSQQSFRPLRWEAFRTALSDAVGGDYLGPVDITWTQLQGGHATRPVRVRVGQSGFRRKMLDDHGPRCAFTGDLPEAVLEACHLYSYAKVGKHYEHGGILLRRDLHTLFDRGIIVVDADDKIDVATPFHVYEIYADLHGSPLTIKPSSQQRKWFELHWIEHRKP